MSRMPESPRAAGGVDGPHGAGPASPAGRPDALSSTRYLAWLYSPPAQQPVLGALCEIEAEVVASLRPGIDHHVAHARLQWWREEFERAAQGRPVHPLTRALVKAYAGARAANEPSPLAGISGFVDTAVWDLAGATFETRKELTAYCERWAAAMFEPAASLAGISSAAPWRALGAAVREIELLANLAREAHAGRLRVPLDELAGTGVDVTALAKTPWPAPLVTLLRERHEALRATIADGVRDIGRGERADFRGLLVWAALGWRLSRRAQRALPNVIRPGRYHALADGWQAWRAARRAISGNLHLK
jgi:15-cis-phytoene synthase